MDNSYVTCHLENHKKNREIKFYPKQPHLKPPSSYEGARLSTQTIAQNILPKLIVCLNEAIIGTLMCI